MKVRKTTPILLALSILTALILSACGGPTTVAPTAGPATAATAPAAATSAPVAATTAPVATAMTEATAVPVATEVPEATEEPETTAGALPDVVGMPDQIAEGRDVTITVVGMPAESQPEALKGWNEQVARFMAKYPNVTIVGSDYAYAPDTFPALVAGQQVPTLFEVYLSDPAKIIEQGVAANLTPFFDKHNLKDVFNPNILAISSDGDDVYGIPKFAYAMGLAYNITMLKDAGFDAAPSNWEELATMAQKLTNRDEGIAGFSFITDGGAATGWQFTTIAYTWGAKQSDIVTPVGDGTFTAGFAEGQPVAALDFVKELRWTYDVLPRENLDWPKNGEALATKRAAMVIMAGDQLSWIRSTFPDVDLKEFGYAPLPAGPDGTSTSLVGGSIGMVSAAASEDEQEAAVYFRLWQQFDPAEILSTYEVSKSDPSVAIGAPVLPLYIGEYSELAEALKAQFANMPTENYAPFVNAVTAGEVQLEAEPATAGQEYYASMGAVVSTILSDESAEPAATVKEAADTFQSNVLDKITQ